MRNYLSGILIIFSLSACTTLEAETPEQKYYAVLQQWTNVQQAAIAYIDDCYENKDEAHECNRVVEKIKDVDLKARDVINSVEFDDSVNIDYVKSATATLQLFASELYNYIQ